MARHAKQPSSRRAGAPAPTGKSVPLSIITGHRATLPILQLETTRGERSAQFYLKHALYSLSLGFRFKGIISINNTLEHSLTVFFFQKLHKLLQ